MRILSRLFGTDSTDKNAVTLSQVEAGAEKVRDELRQASHRFSQATGRHLSDSEQLLGYTAYIYHLARINSLSLRDRERVLADIVEACAGVCAAVRLMMSQPSVVPAIRKYHPTFDPNEMTTAPTNLGGGVERATGLVIGGIQADGYFNSLKAFSIPAQVAICYFMLNKMFGPNATEILLPSTVMRSELDFKKFGETLDENLRSLEGGRPRRTRYQLHAE